MSKSNAWEEGLQKLTFNNTTFATVGDATGIVGSTADGNLYVSLHTADPGEAGTQATSETTYTDYARVAVVRTSSGWTVSVGAVSNAAAVSFPACGATGATLTYFGVGTGSSGAGVLLYSGALTASLIVSSGITPAFAIGELDVTED